MSNIHATALTNASPYQVGFFYFSCILMIVSIILNLCTNGEQCLNEKTKLHHLFINEA